MDKLQFLVLIYIWFHTSPHSKPAHDRFGLFGGIRPCAKHTQTTHPRRASVAIGRHCAVRAMQPKTASSFRRGSCLQNLLRLLRLGRAVCIALRSRIDTTGNSPVRRIDTAHLLLTSRPGITHPANSCNFANAEITQRGRGLHTSPSYTTDDEGVIAILHRQREFQLDAGA